MLRLTIWPQVERHVDVLGRKLVLAELKICFCPPIQRFEVLWCKCQRLCGRVDGFFPLGLPEVAGSHVVVDCTCDTGCSLVLLVRRLGTVHRGKRVDPGAVQQRLRHRMHIITLVGVSAPYSPWTHSVDLLTWCHPLSASEKSPLSKAWFPCDLNSSAFISCSSIDMPDFAVEVEATPLLELSLRVVVALSSSFDIASVTQDQHEPGLWLKGSGCMRSGSCFRWIRDPDRFDIKVLICRSEVRLSTAVSASSSHVQPPILTFRLSRLLPGLGVLSSQRLIVIISVRPGGDHDMAAIGTSERRVR